jgi:GR25 family glycosyltransferase involved in LPS biosynthesis
MDKIDIVYYINLDHRADRNEEFLEWITESGFLMTKVERVPAIYVAQKGYIGCLLSHMKTLEAFIETPHTNCIIFEDDYMPLNVGKFWDNVGKIFDTGIKFDVVLCAYNELKAEETEYSFLRKLKSSTTTSGYLITKEYAPILLQHWKESLNFMMAEETLVKYPLPYMADIYWHKLMSLDNWYTFYPRLGKQRPSYSDIMLKNTHYHA